MSESSSFKSRPDMLTVGGFGGGNRKSWKALKCRRYVIDVTGLDSLSLEELGGGVQCFGEFSASGRARTMKICRCVRELHKLT